MSGRVVVGGGGPGTLVVVVGGGGVGVVGVGVWESGAVFVCNAVGAMVRFFHSGERRRQGMVVAVFLVGCGVVQMPFFALHHHDTVRAVW